MRILQILALGLLVCATVQARKEPEVMSRHQAGLYGEQLLSIGASKLAQAYLEAAVYGDNAVDAIPSLKLSDPRDPPSDREHFAQSLAELYWDNGKVGRAVDVATHLLRKPEMTLWRCRAAESKAYYAFARQCYESLDDYDRAERVIREQALSSSARS